MTPSTRPRALFLAGGHARAASSSNGAAVVGGAPSRSIILRWYARRPMGKN
jgi:hypothetical protein